MSALEDSVIRIKDLNEGVEALLKTALAIGGDYACYAGFDTERFEKVIKKLAAAHTHLFRMR